MLRKIIIPVIVFAIGFAAAMLIFGRNDGITNENETIDVTSSEEDDVIVVLSENSNELSDSVSEESSDEECSVSVELSDSFDSQSDELSDGEDSVSVVPDSKDSSDDDNSAETEESLSTESESVSVEESESISVEETESFSDDTSESEVEKYTIYFDGEYDWFDTDYIDVTFGKSFHTPPSPMKEGFDFMYWVDQFGNQYKADAEYEFTHHCDLTLTAVFC